MNLPELTDSNKLAVEKLTSFSEDFLNPSRFFGGYARNLGSSLQDDGEFSKPLYMDFKDFNYLHDTSLLNHVYLNDFDANLEEDREALARLTRMEFNTNTFETIAKCSESCGHLRGNYLIGSGRVCPKCGNKVERFLDRGQDTNLWLRKPEGVNTFVNIGFFISFFNSVTIGSPQIIVPRYFLDSGYRKQINKLNNSATRVLYTLLQELEITEVNLNVFHERCDDLMNWIFVGNGRRHFKNSQESQRYLEMYQANKHIAFCDYIKVPSRYSTVLEKSGKDIYSYPHQPATAQLYFAISDTFKSTPVTPISEERLAKNVDIVGKTLVALADQYKDTNNPDTLFSKPALNRKHVSSGPLPFTGRSVITSATGIIDPNNLLVPWKMCLAILEHHIFSYLYRRSHTPHQARERLNRAAYSIDPLIDQFFKEMEYGKTASPEHEAVLKEIELQGNRCLVQAGRNPSIEYLSLRTFFLRVNRDLEDESIKLPILAVGPQNADFDGDQEYIVFVFDNESKAKAYGAFGHHLVLDKNIPFKVGGYSGQTSTNLMNLNTLMSQTAVSE